MRPAKAKPVDFELNEIDLEVALLGEAGWHTRAIARETQLTPSQVQYRLGLAGVKRSKYRNGDSEMASFVLNIVKARFSTKDRIAEVRQIPDTFEKFQESYIETSSEKRKPKEPASN